MLLWIQLVHNEIINCAATHRDIFVLNVAVVVVFAIVATNVIVGWKKVQKKRISNGTIRTNYCCEYSNNSGSNNNNNHKVSNKVTSTRIKKLIDTCTHLYLHIYTFTHSLTHSPFKTIEQKWKKRTFAKNKSGKIVLFCSNEFLYISQLKFIHLHSGK